MATEKAYSNFKSAAKSLAPVKFWSSLCWKLRTNRANSISRRFWEGRYKEGGTSGPGSYGRLAEFKISTMNSIIQQHQIASILDLGCGDGNQIRNLIDVDYLGVDISKDAILHCQGIYNDARNMAFLTADELSDETAEMTLSLDVIYHLVEDSVYEAYMRDLFDRAKRYVLIYSSNFNQVCLSPIARPVHVRHRAFNEWISARRKDWTLDISIENPYKKTSSGSSENVSFANFYLYLKKDR